jgi:hypothetical protein
LAICENVELRTLNPGVLSLGGISIGYNAELGSRGGI